MSDDVFERNLLHSRIVNSEQIAVARREQEVLAKTGTRLMLADVLLKQGVITPSIRENVEKICQAQKSGGIQQLGIYKLLKKLGEGGMGAVYLADDTIANRKVALKVLSKKSAGDPIFLERFKREAKAAGSLKHDNIVRAYTARDTDVGEDLGHHYYAMEYCAGKPVEDIIKEQKFLPWEQALDICMQVGNGLQYAHERGIIHRDIKPGNIYMCSDGVAKILDMGLSKNIGGDAAQSFNTLEGQVLGTPHYISPEQAQGQKNIDGRADMYSLGAALYHMLTGETCYTGATAANIIFKHVTDVLPNPQKIRPEIPDALYRLLQKMMAKEPSERYRDCAAMLADMALVKSGTSPLTASEQAAKAAREAQQRQAADDARFMRDLTKWGKIAGMAFGGLVLILILKSVIGSFFGPSKKDLERRAAIQALRDDGDESLRKGNLQQAMDKFDKIIAISAADEAKDQVTLDEVERAKKDKAQVVEKLAAATQAKDAMEAQARAQEDERKKLAEEKRLKVEDERKQAELQKKQDEARRAEEALKAEAQKKADELALIQQRAEQEKLKKQQDALAAEKLKKEAAAVALAERQELLKRRAPLRAECIKPAETALFELTQLEKKLSNGSNYAQFNEALRDNWSRVQLFLDQTEVKTLIESLKDEDIQSFRDHVQSAGENLFKLQSNWKEKNSTGKDIDLQVWTGKLYADIEDARATLEKIKKNE